LAKKKPQYFIFRRPPFELDAVAEGRVPEVGSAAEEIFQDEKGVGGAFGEAAHEIGIPGIAIGDVEAEAVAAGDEHALEIATDAVQHLKFERRRGAVVAGGVLDDDVDHAGIVGGDGRVFAFVEKDACEARVT